ncbi:MAG: glycerate kinase [Clostridiales bacterium]|nr:glycerate kinase [Clostridiales bacterium]
MKDKKDLKVVIAPDSFKGSLTSLEAANAIKKGFELEGVSNCICIPMADGGEGTVDAMISATGGKLVKCKATDPMGTTIDAFYGILGDGKTAVIEMAAASGLPLVKTADRNPMLASTFGTGELMLDAVNNGCSKLIIGIGGSATNDGGTGMAKALGIQFLDINNNELHEGGGALIDLYKINTTHFDKRFYDIEIQVACDVDNPLCGESGASYVYGPQKGATQKMVTQLDRSLRNLAYVLKKDMNKDILDLPGAGAAGGLGGGLFAFVDAKLLKGIHIMMEAANIDEQIKNADLVITGEGQTDYQTAFGKVPAGIAEITSKYKKPLICISGSLGKDYEKLYDIGITSIFSICNKPMNLKYAIENAEELITNLSQSIARLVARQD